MPLVTGIAMGRPTAGALAIAAAGVAVFFAHEPALVWMGKRGERARREAGTPARRRLLVLGVIALAGAVVAVVSAPLGALVAATPLVPAAAVVGWLALRGDEKTAPGEMLAAAALAGVAVPVAIAAGVQVTWAIGAWAAWTLAFGASTLAVRAVIAHAKNKVAPWRRALPPIGAAAIAISLGMVAPWWSAVAAVPMILVASVIAAAPPSPRSLRRVGWTLVTSSIAAAAILIAGAHLD